MRTTRRLSVFAGCLLAATAVAALSAPAASASSAGRPSPNDNGRHWPTPTTSSRTWSPYPTPTRTSSTPTPTPTRTTSTPTPTPTSATPTPTPTTSTTAPPPPPANSACGGEIVVEADGSTPTCTFDDEFDGTSLNTANWTPVTTSSNGYHSGKECFIDSADNLSVGGGVLSMTVRKEAAPFTCVSPKGNYSTQYTSGAVMSYGHFSQAYGRFEVRASFPAATVAGLQSALWLWPVNQLQYGAYPATGEIDIAEEYSLHPDRAIPYIHYIPSAIDYNITNNYCTLTDVSAFHDYVLDWTTSSLTITYDGKTCISDSWNPMAPLVKPQPFDQPFFINLTQALGIGSNVFNASTTPLPATTQVDYVRVWS